MSDISYSVEVKFFQSGSISAPAAQVKDLHAQAEKLGQTIKDLEKGFGGLGRSSSRGSAARDLRDQASDLKSLIDIRNKHPAFAGIRPSAKDASRDFALDFDKNKEARALKSAKAEAAAIKEGARLKKNAEREALQDAKDRAGDLKSLIAARAQKDRFLPKPVDKEANARDWALNFDKQHKKNSESAALEQAAAQEKARAARGAAAERIGAGFQAAAGAVHGFNSLLDSIATTAIGVAATIGASLVGAFSAGAVAATKTAFAFNEQMENTTISLGAIANANGMTENLQGGFRIAGDVIREMRKDAATLPGEFKDLEGIVTTIASPLGQMGVGLWGAEKMGAKTMAAAAILKVPQEVAGREMAMMLEGGARHQMPFFNRLGLGSPKEFNALKPEERLARVREALDRLNPAVDSFKNSWTGIKTTALDNIRAGLGAIGAPLFGSVKDIVGKFNDWVGASGNKEKLQDWGIALSEGINKAFLGAVDGIREWYPPIRAFAENLYNHIKNAWDRFGPVVEGLAEKFKSFLTDPGAVDKIVEAARIFAGVRIGGGALEGGLSAAGSIAPALGAIGGEGGAMAGLEALGAVAAPLAVVVGAVAAAFYGIWDVITDTSNVFNSFASGEFRLFKYYIGAIGEDFVKLMGALRPVADVLGVGLLIAATELAHIFKSIMDAVKDLVGAISSAVDWIRDKLGLVKLNKDLPPEPIEYPQYTGIGGDMSLGWAVKELNATAEREKDRKVPQSVTHIHRVEIKVNSNQDPNRIAKRVVGDLVELARHPKSAANAGNPQVTR